jgi:hypothetical protein
LKTPLGPNWFPRYAAKHEMPRNGQLPAPGVSGSYIVHIFIPRPLNCRPTTRSSSAHLPFIRQPGILEQPRRRLERFRRDAATRRPEK